MSLSADVDVSSIADICDNFTGADFKALLYDAQLTAIHERQDALLTTCHLGEDLIIEEKERDQLPGVLEHPGTLSTVMDGLSGVVEETQGPSGVLKDVKKDDVLCGWSTVEVVNPQRVPSTVVVVTQAHLLHAAQTLRPSVSAKERLKYKLMYVSCFLPYSFHLLSLFLSYPE